VPAGLVDGAVDLGQQEALTVLDQPLVGDDSQHVARLAERLRGRAVATFAARHHAGTVAVPLPRYGRSAAGAWRTAFLAAAHLDGLRDVARCAARSGPSAVRPGFRS
jgi:hypothetical protein